jgi:hypothetical protein
MVAHYTRTAASRNPFAGAALLHKCKIYKAVLIFLKQESIRYVNTRIY